MAEILYSSMTLDIIDIATGIQVSTVVLLIQ